MLKYGILWNTKDVWLNTYRGVNYERMLEHGHTLENQGDAVAKEGYERERGVTLGVRHKRDAGCNMTQQARIFLYK